MLLTVSDSELSDMDQTTVPINAEPVPDPGPDTEEPTVKITFPIKESTVSGIVPIAVDATDNVGVAKVVFFVGERNKIGVDKTAPYSLDWDTTAFPNGKHKIIAKAVDLAGNKRKKEAEVFVAN